MKVRLRGIDLRNLNHNDQYKVIKQITNDTCIRFVSNFIYGDEQKQNGIL